MIFVILGSQKFQFNRLLSFLDKCIDDGQINDTIVAQTGYSTYCPNNYEYKDFYSKNEFSKLIDKADIVITHAGTGAIIESVKKNKKVIAVARLSKYGEHVDDHQIQICQEFEKLNLIKYCHDFDDMPDILKKINDHTFNTYQSNTQNILDSIKEFIDSL